MASNARDRVLNLVDQEQAARLRREERLVREVAGAYEAARKDLLSALSDAYARLGPDPSAADVRRLATDAGLLRAIERRLAQLEDAFGDVLRGELTQISGGGFEAAAAEIDVLAQSLGLPFFNFRLDPLLELTIGPAVDQVPAVAASLRANITGSLRESLAAGERFGDVARTVLAREGSAFRNGYTSAELMTRRAVVQAANNSKLLYYERARQRLPDLQKQAVAHLGPNTTRTCLGVHGQIQDLEEPFRLTAEPRFAPRQKQPPFHWRCRTAVAPYLADFEETSSLRTSDMRAAARALLN